MRKRFVDAMIGDAHAEHESLLGATIAAHVELRVEGAAGRQAERPGQPARSRGDDRRPRHAAGAVVGDVKRGFSRPFLGSTELSHEIDHLDSRRRGRAPAAEGDGQQEQDRQRGARREPCAQDLASAC